MLPQSSLQIYRVGDVKAALRNRIQRIHVKHAMINSVEPREAKLFYAVRPSGVARVNPKAFGHVGGRLGFSQL
jgi:hypothetical protein